MILNGPTTEEPLFMVNLHYTEDVSVAQKLVDYVRFSPIGILISSAYLMMLGDIEQGIMTRRSGFQFNFWFLTETEARIFAEEWKSLVWYWDDENTDIIRSLPYNLQAARKSNYLRMVERSKQLGLM
jgi:hypothetical protein